MLHRMFQLCVDRCSLESAAAWRGASDGVEKRSAAGAKKKRKDGAVVAVESTTETDPTSDVGERIGERSAAASRQVATTA